MCPAEAWYCSPWIFFLPSGYWLFSETTHHFSSKRKVLENKQILHGWRDRHNLDRYLSTTQRNKYDLDLFETCDRRELEGLYELSDCFNLADHHASFFFFSFFLMISRSWKPMDNMHESHLNVWLVDSTKLTQNSPYALGIITKILETQLPRG